MNWFTLSAAVATTLAASAIATSGAAAAAPTGDTSAADTVKALEAMGYSVQINGEVVGPLADCTVTGVHGLADGAPTSFDTAYVDVTCPSGNA
jgi:polyisoprenoid-binding protein YceI